MAPDVRTWRRWSWILVIWTIGAIVLAIIALATLGDACSALDGFGLTVCATGAAVGGLLIVFIVFWAWLIGFLLLSVAWLARRPTRRLCPPYGHPVDEGETRCLECGYDFILGEIPTRRAALAPAPSAVPLEADESTEETAGDPNDAAMAAE